MNIPDENNWVVVPREPTLEMARAAIALDPKCDLDAKYRAMIAAAPVTAPVVSMTVYESAVKGRSDFREAFRRSRDEYSTDSDVKEALASALKAAGSYSELGRCVGVSDEFVRNACHGSRPVTGVLLGFLGFRRVVAYKKIGA